MGVAPKPFASASRLGDDVDGEDPLRSSLARSEDREEPDGTTAKDGVDARGPRFRHVRAEEASREHVPEKKRRLHVDVGGKLDERRVGQRNAHVLRLRALEAAAVLDPSEELPLRCIGR